MTGARTNLQDELKIFIRKRADKRVQQLQKNKIRQEEYHEGNYGDVWFPETRFTGIIRLWLDEDAEFQKAGGFKRSIWKLLCGKHAMYAGEKGTAHGQNQFFPQKLGADGAVWRLRPADFEK